jgi:hypothetical protein
MRSPPLGPGGAPFAGWRWVFTVLAGMALVANTLLMLSDRAPGLLSRASDRLERSERIPTRALSESPLPDTSEVVHVTAWAVAMVLVGLSMWSWRSLLVAAAMVFGFSAVLEPAQEHLTQMRSMQADDIVANAVGVGLGVVVVSVVWVAMGAWHRRRAARRRPAHR